MKENTGEDKKKKKIKVQICTGTTCFVMGGSELLLLPDILPDELKDVVELEGINCMEQCKGKSSNAPFVKINGNSFPNATLSSLADEIGRIYAQY